MVRSRHVWGWHFATTRTSERSEIIASILLMAVGFTCCIGVLIVAAFNRTCRHPRVPTHGARPARSGTAIGGSEGHRLVTARTTAPRHATVPRGFTLQFRQRHLGLCRNHFAASSCSISRRRLYFSTRSDRDNAPVLMYSAFVATARSAMNVSAVSPERCEMMTRYLCFRASAIARIVSVSDPIWFTLMRIAFPTFMR